LIPPGQPAGHQAIMIAVVASFGHRGIVKVGFRKDE